MNFFTTFENSKRATLWYMAMRNGGYTKNDSIDYAMFKAYHLWGVDGLNQDERDRFSLTF